MPSAGRPPAVSSTWVVSLPALLALAPVITIPLLDPPVPAAGLAAGLFLDGHFLPFSGEAGMTAGPWMPYHCPSRAGNLVYRLILFCHYRKLKTTRSGSTFKKIMQVEGALSALL